MSSSNRSSTSSQLFQSIKNSENERAKSLSQPLLDDIEELVDGENSTLLHIAANNNNYDMAEFYLNAYNQLIRRKPSEYTEDSKLLWISARDNEGFSCLHYAVFRGNFKMVTLFEKNGADIYQINNQGLTVLHIAAQGDSPLLMYYFLNKGLKIGVADAKGSTPLHWACYSGMENAVYALISWGAEIDKQEFTFGMTPLHLAVMSGNGRIVKKLLLKGCDRNIRAYNGKLALDIAKQNEYKNISEMIIDKQGIEQLMNIKTPFRKLHKHTLPFYLLLFLYLTNYLLNVIFVLHATVEFRLDLSITFLVLGFIVGVLFLLCKLSNPGYLKPKNPSSMFQILLKNKSPDICYDCKIVKPQRSRHCEVCSTCICVFDHHCPWIANCVGAGNYLFFWIFLISMLIFMVFTIAFEIVNLVNNDWRHWKFFSIIEFFTEIYSLTVCALFLLPLIFLIIVQTKNTFENKTTFQRYAYRKQESVESSQRESLTQTISDDRSSSHKPSNVSEELKMRLVDKKCNSNSLEIQIEGKQAIKNSLSRNCFMMCIGNQENLRYQVAL